MKRIRIIDQQMADDLLRLGYQAIRHGDVDGGVYLFSDESYQEKKRYIDAIVKNAEARIVDGNQQGRSNVP